MLFSNTQMLAGAIGDLETITDIPPEATHAVVICHPHPLFGGTMQNKVVHTLAKTFVELGMATVRFNFRGVGKSAGEYDQGIGETDDALAMIKWLQTQLPQAKILLAGFSFGSYVAARAANVFPAEYLITIAPAVEHFDFTPLQNIHCPWLVVQGEQDEIVPPELVYQWAASRHPSPKVIRLPEVTHFFHGHLLTLRDIVLQELTKTM